MSKNLTSFTVLAALAATIGVACMSKPQASTETKETAAAATPSPTPIPRSPNAAPKWLVEQHKKSKASPPQRTSFAATEWKFKGKTVYRLDATECCDIPNELFSDKGKKICMLGGGFTGAIDPQCANFETEATLVGSLPMN